MTLKILCMSVNLHRDQWARASKHSKWPHSFKSIMYCPNEHIKCYLAIWLLWNCTNLLNKTIFLFVFFNISDLKICLKQSLIPSTRIWGYPLSTKNACSGQGFLACARLRNIIYYSESHHLFLEHMWVMCEQNCIGVYLKENKNIM